MFYYLTKSALGPKAPQLLYLFGGPGIMAGGINVGLFGPFHATKNGFKENPYSWHKFCNILLIDWPYQVGFSSDKNVSKYMIGMPKPKKWIPDLNQFMVNIFEKYPELNESSIYLGGDSSNGVFIPSMLMNLKTYFSQVPYVLRIKGVLLDAPYIGTQDRLKYGDLLVNQAFHLTDSLQRTKFLKTVIKLLAAPKKF